MNHSRDPSPACGDRFFQRSPEWISRTIAWATRQPRETPTLATHDGLFVGAGTLMHCYSAAGGRVVPVSWAFYRHELEREGCEWCILRREPEFTPIEQDRLRAAAWPYNGRRYSVGEVGLQFIDQRLLGGRLLFRRLGNLSPRLICSKFAVMPFIAIGEDPPSARYEAPDDTWDRLFRQTPAIKGGDPYWYAVLKSDAWFEPAIAPAV